MVASIVAGTIAAADMPITKRVSAFFWSRERIEHPRVVHMCWCTSLEQQCLCQRSRPEVSAVQSGVRNHPFYCVTRAGVT